MPDAQERALGWQNSSDEPPPMGDPIKPRDNPPVKDPPPDEKPNPARY